MEIMKTKIKNEIRDAMKSRNIIKRDILRVLMSEIERCEQSPIGKIELPTEFIVALIKKMVTNIRLTEGGDTPETAILSEYLPTVLSNDDIVVIITEVMDREGIDSMKGLGIIMKEFSTKYKNQYDGKQVSTIIREILS